MTDAEALDKIARILHDEPVSQLSATEQAIVRILDKTPYGNVEETWNWSRAKRVKYFIWHGSE